MTVRRRARRPWTLRSRLVVGTAAVVTAVLVTVGVVSSVTLASSITHVVDTQLSASMSSFTYAVEKYRYGVMIDSGRHIDPHPEKPLTDYTGQAPGTVIALLDEGSGDGSGGVATVIDSARFSDSDAEALPPAVVAQLEAASLEPGTQQTLQLDGLGSYRVAVEPDSRGDLLVTGISMATADAAVLQETVIMVVLALIALLVIVVGVIVVVRLALRPLGRVVGTAVAVTDIPLDRGDVAITTRVGEADTDPRTEVGKVGEALNQLLAHVDDALAVRAETDKRMRRFVTDASHELRTPLAAIQGYAELTRQDAASLPEITEYSLARIESEAKRMNSLVSDLLLLARIDEGQDLHLDEIDLGEVVVNAVSDAKASAPGHHWSVEVPDAPALVTGDRERLHQVVLNLLSNAAVHTPDGTRVSTTLRIDPGAPAAGAAGSAAVGETVVLDVADDGPGIPESLQPELFQRFARGDSSRSRRAGSTGLGLAIVASIVEAHDGTIGVHSTPAGTRFTVRFTRVAGAVAAPPAGRVRPQVTESAG
ncbi:sensor histidine kinase [Herbiconiux sp. A18JL235]|uniref:histidine kinase n=1 Tax=Herbiconiux sp. A18JL235 TaxID=3152363 RepID=A0AB39BEW3_9MICO